MNRFVSSIIFLLLAILMFAQTTADIEVSYVAHSTSLKDGKTDLTNQFILLANANESKFFSPMTDYLDSLQSTPQGKAQYQQMTTNAYLSGKMNKIPRKDGSYYVVRSTPENIVRYYDSAGLDKYFYEETPDQWRWEIADLTKQILGYECILASTDYHGRKWTVWFSPEIPVHNGPWKLDGLPGLILEATAEGGQYQFIATGIQPSTKTIGPVYLASDYEKTTRKEFLKAKRSFMDNPLGKLKASMGALVTIKNADGSTLDGSIFVSDKIVDFIETDYRN